MPPLLVGGRSAGVANGGAGGRRQCLLPLLVRQPAPKLLEHQRDRRARGGIMVVAAADMGFLLESRIGEFASTATTRVSREGRLWVRSPHSVKAKQWRLSYSCLYRPGQRSRAWKKIKPTQILPCVIIGYRLGRRGVHSVLVATVHDGGLQYVGQVSRGFSGAAQVELTRRLIAQPRSHPVVPCPTRACWVEPELYCRVRFQDWTSRGRL